MLDNPMNYQENREKISSAMQKWRNIPRGTTSTMSEEAYKEMHSKASSNRNKTMWQKPEYREYMNEKMHASQYHAIK